MKKLMVSISVVFFILTTGCEMRTTSKQQPSNERAMSIAGSPVYEKDSLYTTKIDNSLK
ncbi:NF038215 family lipoprotein [Acinetobacter baumannii]|uniref:NF038215 family lipoprotein n=1 Tax=Acinetobacter baumannii TaxID=470 RepID=UPI003D0753A4